MAASSSSRRHVQDQSPSSMKSSFSNCGGRPIDVCFCNRRIPMRVVSTDENAGRRFYGCFYFSKQCGHFEWVDPPLTRRGVKYSLQLQREIRDLQNRLSDCSASAYVREVEEISEAQSRDSSELPIVENDSEQIRFLRIVIMLLLIVIVFMFLLLFGGNCRK